MKRDESGFGKFLALPLTVAISALSIIFLFSATGASALTPQGKGGTIKPAPTPTPATTKTTAPKKSTTPAKTNRAGTSKPPVRQAEPEAVKPSAAEIAFWETIKDSKNPEEFRAYLKKYPNGEFADLARSRLNALEAAAKEEATRKEEAKKAEDKREEAKRKEEAEKKRAGTVVKNSIGMELVYIPAGSFMMGGTYTNEKPVHQVTISNGFYIGRYEVTQGQWRQVMGTTVKQQRDKDQYSRKDPIVGEGDTYPMYFVNWNEAQDFIKKLNAMNDGYVYRLPTESEWEYACRAGTATEFSFGDSLSSEQANFDQSRDAPKKGTTPVGSFPPNAFGLYDMHGNVFELCEDWFHETYHGAPTDGSAWLSGGEQRERVWRGGGWDFGAGNQRSAARYGINPILRAPNTGFRVVAIARAQ
jgi:formylglycine-generating enzyme required for sulfatase activity